MSRIGKKPISIPDGVKVSITETEIPSSFTEAVPKKGYRITVVGPKGTLERVIPPPIKVRIDKETKRIFLECHYETSQDKALHGLMRSLVNNMTIGVSQGYEKRLEIIGVGYNAKLQGQELILQVGFTHPIKIIIPQGITVNLPNPNLIIVTGVDKQLVGEFAAKIRAIRPADPYTLKGIKYSDEIIRRKAGKTFVSGR